MKKNIENILKHWHEDCIKTYGLRGRDFKNNEEFLESLLAESDQGILKLYACDYDEERKKILWGYILSIYELYPEAYIRLYNKRTENVKQKNLKRKKPDFSMENEKKKKKKKKTPVKKNKENIIILNKLYIYLNKNTNKCLFTFFYTTIVFRTVITRI